MSKIVDDPRIDPRIKAVMGAMPIPEETSVSDRDVLLKEVNQPEAIAAQELLVGMLDMLDSEEVAPSSGLDVSTIEFTSQPDDNTVKIQFIRPQTDETLPCVFYIHGGGMKSMSCYDGMYRSWGRIIANQGVAVAMECPANCLAAICHVTQGKFVPGKTLW